MATKGISGLIWILLAKGVFYTMPAIIKKLLLVYIFLAPVWHITLTSLSMICSVIVNSTCCSTQKFQKQGLPILFERQPGFDLLTNILGIFGLGSKFQVGGEVTNGTRIAFKVG